MASDIYWIDAVSPIKLAIMARPRAGDWLEDEVEHWKRSGVEVVVSLLEPDEIDELGLGMEAALCERAGIRYLTFPIPDRGVPDPVEAMRLVEDLARSGERVAIHCRAGIGRSSIMAAAVLISGDVDPEEALMAIARARGTSVPDTDAQRDWIRRLTRPR